MGDKCYSCLKDLNCSGGRATRRRTDRREDILSGLLNDLIPRLMNQTAGKGHVREDKRAIACADLITAMAWPIDIAEELKEVDEELDKAPNYAKPLSSHL